MRGRTHLIGLAAHHAVLAALTVVAVFFVAVSPSALGQAPPDAGAEPGARPFRPKPDRPGRGSEPPPRGQEPPPRGRGFEPPLREFETVRTVKEGFVFIDGEYVSPPYEVRYADEQITINGRVLTCEPPPRGYYGRGYGGPPRSEQPWRDAFSMVTSNLSNNSSLVMSFPGQPLFMPDAGTTYELLSSLVTVKERSNKQLAVRDRLPDEFDRQVWDQWLDSFEPPENLRQRTALLVYSFDQAQETAQAQIRAQRFLERLAYPLSVSAMVMSVLAIGHLLGGRPHAGQPTRGIDDSAAMIRALNWSLLFSAIFSILDLVWTIVTINTNDIEELNPIGRHLIHDPGHLAGFKTSITFSCLAIIWLLRKHKRAQIAAWWVCLVLTLVTCRWILANSLLTSAA